MGYTLIIGRADDPCCELASARLRSLGHRVMFFSEHELFPGLRFAWQLNGASSGSLGLAGQIARFEEIDAVLARFSGIACSPEEFETKNGRYLSSEWHALIRGYLESLPCPVVNRPGPELWYRSFLRAADLMSLVPDLKLQTPRTIVTTSFEDALAFFDLCGGRICYSPLTHRSNYFINTTDDLRKLASLSNHLPLHLSERVSGEALDAYVVGNRVIINNGSHIFAEALCLNTAASLKLCFCRFRLIRTAEDAWYCLSLDCAPSLLECGVRTRDAVVDGLVETLSSRERLAS
jgi:hypothetical protein